MVGDAETVDMGGAIVVVIASTAGAATDDVGVTDMPMSVVAPEPSAAVS